MNMIKVNDNVWLGLRKILYTQIKCIILQFSILFSITFNFNYQMIPDTYGYFRAFIC